VPIEEEEKKKCNASEKFVKEISTEVKLDVISQLKKGEQIVDMP
jgi:hypothetical protein